MRVSEIFALLLALSAWAAPGLAAAAQEPQATPVDTADARVAIPASDIVSRAEQAIIELREYRTASLPDLSVDQIARELPDLVQSLSHLKVSSDPENLVGLSIRGVDHLWARWLAPQARLDGWQSGLAARTQVLENARGQVLEIGDVWETTSSSASALDLPEVLLGQAESVLATVDSVETDLRARRDTVLALQQRISQERIEIAEIVTRILRSQAQVRDRMFTRGSPPLWSALLSPNYGIDVTTQVRDAWAEGTAEFQEFRRNNTQRLLAHVLLFAAALLLTIWVRRHV